MTDVQEEREGVNERLRQTAGSRGTGEVTGSRRKELQEGELGVARDV